MVASTIAALDDCLTYFQHTYTEMIMAQQPQNSGQTTTPVTPPTPDPLPPVQMEDVDITALFAGVLQSILARACNTVAATSTTINGFQVNDDGQKPISMTMTIGNVSRTFYLILATEEPSEEVPTLTEDQLRAAHRGHNVKF